MAIFGTIANVNQSAEEAVIVELAANRLTKAQMVVDTCPIDLELIIGLAERHRVSAKVLQRLSSINLPEQLRQPAVAAAQQIIMLTMASNRQIRLELKDVAKALRESEIDFLVIKGMAIDDSDVRRTSDLDILIHEQDLSQAFSCLKAAEYRYVPSDRLKKVEVLDPTKQLRWNHEFKFLSRNSDLSVEIHTNLLERNRVRLEGIADFLDNSGLFWEQKEWNRQLGCYIPSPEASLALLCMHSATKRSPANDTYILRHAHDILLLLERGIDDERFLNLCDSWSIDYFAYVGLYLARISMDSDLPQKLVTTIRARLPRSSLRLGEIHIRCYRGLGTSSPYYRFLYSLLMPFAIGGGIGKSITWYFRALFPTRRNQEIRYGIHRNSPLILTTYVFGPIARLWSAILWLVEGRRRSLERAIRSRPTSPPRNSPPASDTNLRIRRRRR